MATTSLPLLAVPSGATHKRRKRHNELDELEEELLRIQIRQHFGHAAATCEDDATPSTRMAEPRGRYRKQRSASSSSSSEASLLSGSGSGGGGSPDAFDMSSLGATLFASRGRLADAWTLIQRLLWVSDEDMSEEINESDPKILAGKQFLKGVEAFSMLSENELAQLVGLSELRAFKGGDVVVSDEREADGLYIVLSGSAARFPLPTPLSDDASETTPSASSRDLRDDEYASESFGYQDHFGSIISPTEHAQAERGESAVVATADVLECLWIPDLAVRMLNVQPRMDYEFALIFHRGRASSSRAHEEIVANLLRAGIHVAVLANTRLTTSSIVLLLSAPLWLLAREDKLLTMERIVEHQSAEDAALLEGDESYESRAETLSASDRIAAFASILTRPASDKPPGVGLQGIESNQDAVVKDVFPLHDPSMTDFILSTWFKETHTTSSTKRLFLLRIKDYFGLRIAFFTAFVRLYIAALVYPLNVGCLLWIFWRWLHYRSYVQALGVYGLCVAFVWAPSFVKRWLRYQNSLLVEWNLLGAQEVALPNLQFKDYVVETINIASSPQEPPDLVEVKTYDHRRRWPKYAIFGLFCLVCLVLLFVLVGVYVQWYIIAVMTPMCTDPRCPQFLDTPGGCESHCHALFAQGKNHLFMQPIVSCADYCNAAHFDRSYYQCDEPLVGCFATERGILGTARWAYVLIQGVVLGLTLDIVFLAVFEAIACGFNDWENYPTEQEKETRFIEKIFLFNWVGYFYWFLLLAFVYVPNGARVQAFIRDHIDSTLNESFRFSRYWVDGLISMDSAFVTPMIVTQALNLVINTFVPYLLRRAIIKARDSYHVKKERLSCVLATAQKRTTSQPQKHKPGFNRIDVSEPSSHSEAAPTDDEAENQWLSPADLAGLDRREVALMLAQRAEIKAEQLETHVGALFRGVASHESHMEAICGSLTAHDLDVHQRTSYDWLDRVTRALEDRGQLKGVGGRGGEGDDTKLLEFITQWQCRHYLYTADRVLEESSMPIYSPAKDLLHLAIQFSYTILFSVVWPFCCLCAFARNAVALRFDAIKMTIDCKRPIPRRTIGIGNAWLGALLFEILVAQVVVPGLFVYVSGQLDAFYEGCDIRAARYGPAANAEDPECGLDAGARLQAFVALENVGIVVVFLIYLKTSAMSHETSIKVVAHSRRLKHHVRKSVRVIGETVLVGVASRVVTSPGRSRGGVRIRDSTETPGEEDATTGDGFFAVDLSPPVHPLGSGGGLHRRRTHGVLEMAQTKAALDGTMTTPTKTEDVAAERSVVEWREGTVAWVKSGRLKVNFSGGRQLSTLHGPPHSSSQALPYSESEVWLANQETYVIMEPTPVQIFTLGMPVLLASKKFGRWTEATVVALDTKDRFGKELTATPNEMHVTFVEGQNLRTHAARQAGLMDPYCVLTVDSGGAASVRHTSSVKRSTLNPVWDERVVFPLSERELYGLGSDAAVGPPATTTSVSAVASAAVSSASSRSTSHAGMDRVATVGTSTQATLTAAVAAFHRSPSNTTNTYASSAAGVGASAPRRTLKISVLNNDAIATGESVGDVEIDLNQLRDGARHRVLVPLSQKRHIWTLDAIQSVMRKQAMGGVHYPMLGRPHLLVELQWIDTRLPTRVTVRVKGQQSDITLSRKLCATNLCYGVDPARVVHAGAAL